jgi:hypothetical protein
MRHTDCMIAGSKSHVLFIVAELSKSAHHSGIWNTATISIAKFQGSDFFFKNSLTLQQTKQTNKQTPWSKSASELYRPSDRRLSAKWLPTFADIGCHVVSVTDPYGRIQRFYRQEPLLFYQVAPQLYSRGWVDPVPDPLRFFSGSSGNRTRASGSVAKNSNH